MAIKIKKNGKIEQFTLHSTDVKVLDLEGKFKKKDLESVIREISDTEHIHIGEVDTAKDGIWIDDGEILDNSENNGVVERLKEYVDNKSKLIKLVNVEVDFNKLEDGRYFINTTKESLKNAPNSVSNGGLLTINKCYDGLSQILISSEGRIYYRKLWYVYWGEWNELMSANQISHPNLLINGDFQVWQRGASFTTHGYSADRWRTLLGSGTVEVTKTKMEQGTSDNALQLHPTTICNLWQVIEGANHLSGKTVTLSFDAYANKEFEYRVYLTDGKEFDGTPVVGEKIIKLTTQRKTYSFTFELPRLTSDNLCVTIYRGSEDIIMRFANVKLELGSVATPFIPRPYGEELALCQRYYFAEDWSNVINKVLFKVAVDNFDRGSVYFPVTMRTPPTLNITWSDETNSHAEYIQSKGYDSLTTNGFTPFVNRTSEGVSDARFVPAIKKYTADAEIY